jgi:hypothetical protein
MLDKKKFFFLVYLKGFIPIHIYKNYQIWLVQEQLLL